MDNLKIIIRLLPDEACKEFKVFANRRKKKTGRKDLELFDLMREQNLEKPAEYLSVLYPEEKKVNAYHTLRKRLFKHLISFLVLRRMDEDNTGAAMVMGEISLVRYLLDMGNDRLAWIYLRKSEKLAIENEQYDLLNGIYRLQVEHANSEFADQLADIIAKRKKYKNIADVEESSVMALSLIRQRLNEVRLQSKQFDFDKIITNTLTEFELSGILYQNPKYLFNILAITRSAILAKKDFYSFEPYAIKQYRLLVKKGVFNKSNHLYKLNILYMICHVLYRNRKFDNVLEYLHIFSEGLQEHDSAYARKFKVRYAMLLAATKSYLGLSRQSIEILEALLVENNDLNDAERLGVILNLGLYYFQLGDLKNANYTSVRLGHTDKWYEKKLGVEWVMKKNLMEVIIQYELGNVDIVLNRLKAFHRNYGKLFSNPIYDRVQQYVDLIRKMIDNPSMLNAKTFEYEVVPMLVQVPEEQEDLQAMTFYSWLKSKFLKKGFYEVLLDTVAFTSE